MLSQTQRHAHWLAGFFTIITSSSTSVSQSVRSSSLGISFFLSFFLPSFLPSFLRALVLTGGQPSNSLLYTVRRLSSQTCSLLLLCYDATMNDDQLMINEPLLLPPSFISSGTHIQNCFTVCLCVPFSLSQTWNTTILCHQISKSRRRGRRRSSISFGATNRPTDSC